MKRYYIETFGCQMNVHDSEKMAGVLRSEGYAEAESAKDADVIIFNTCSIRQKAEQKFFSELGRIKSLKKKRPDLKIAVAGCIAQQEGIKVIKRAPHVDYVIGPQNINVLKDIITSKSDSIFTDDNPSITEIELPVDRRDNVRAWVNIMYGCNNFCSYCIVPYTRGRERSRASQSIINEIKDLAEKGYKEVTLLGQNVNSYKSNVDFPGLLKEINKIEGIKRIRFVTSHPKDLSDKLIYAIRDMERVCEHIHLPLQSGSSKILASMNRKYTYEDYLKKVEKLRREIPEIAITSDIIAGFSQETDEDHNYTISALKNIEFDGIFAFKFSPRPGTKASNIDGQLPDGIKSDRLSEILDLQSKITERKNKELKGTFQEVLIEGEDEKNTGKFTGRTMTNKVVYINAEDDIKIGDIVKVKIINARRYSLEGEIV
ncbi:MAG: tRNA (N6-isopentenyl adenosine(37)-C2)-methylthiotransferase MiaB [Nitrospiraceae bacterium]|nr:tRNA (N6-isopentenyl adenosine(37)-C2)-methylthiotransferase MiaB [Nitrospirota bacterium]MDA8338869.1 tRNA (N6-isopentenyl adenosine(37)-C2)-methylthiotransferase MiaB [Nitrospiraceae bacterium]